MDLEKTSGTTESSGDASAVEKVSASGLDCSGSPVELPENKTESAETPHDVDEHYHAKRFSADDMNIEQEAPAVEHYKASIEQAIEKKEYQHWATPEQMEANRRAITEYDQKKRTADKTALQTQQEFLNRYPDFFDTDNIKRMSSELGSNKLEIYTPEFFSEKFPEGTDASSVVGFREFPSGKISIKDTDDSEMLKHTVTHETLHDLSYQHEADDAITQGPEGNETVKHVRRLQNGVEQVITTERIYLNDEAREYENKRVNRGINEGLTEMYTIEALEGRGEDPGFAGYTAERGWALFLQEKMGDETVARAYFGGDVNSLEEKFNGMTDIPDAWQQFNGCVDSYLRFASNPDLRKEEPGVMEYYERTAWEILESLRDESAGGGRTRSSGLTRKRVR